jgi:tetrahydromethanopterin S-methyltransferase subunit G
LHTDPISTADFQTAFKRLEDQSRELEAAQVETMGDIGGKKPLPATNPAS